MSDVLETIEHKGYTVEVLADQSPESPREWSSLGTMVCFHPRYDLGDKHGYRSDMFTGWSDLGRTLREDQGAVILLPVYLYNHGGVALRVGPEWERPITKVGGKGGADHETLRAALNSGNPFIGRANHAEWDSGMVGFIYATRAAIAECYGVPAKRITPALRARVATSLVGEVEVYSAYVNGDCYGVRVLDPDGEELEDLAYWGLYGYEGQKAGIDESLAEIDGIITTEQGKAWLDLMALPAEIE